jgi:hypothetical protein
LRIPGAWEYKHDESLAKELPNAKRIGITSPLLSVAICRSRSIPRQVAPQDSVTLGTKQCHEVAPFHRQTQHVGATRVRPQKTRQWQLFRCFFKCCKWRTVMDTCFAVARDAVTPVHRLPEGRRSNIWANSSNLLQHPHNAHKKNSKVRHTQQRSNIRYCPPNKCRGP